MSTNINNSGVHSRRPLHEDNTSSSRSIEKTDEPNRQKSHESDTISSNYSDEENSNLNRSNNSISEKEQWEVSSTSHEKPKQKHITARKKISPYKSRPYQPESFTKATSNSLLSTGFLYKVLIGLVFLVITIYVCNAVSTTKQIKQRCRFDNLRNQSPKQTEEVWKTLYVGVENILNETTHSPSVFLFLHQENKEVNRLIQEIAKAASKCFGHKSQPVEMGIKDFTSAQAIKDYGYAIEQYKTKVKEGNVILIANLNQIPANAARSLHSICDTYNPIVNDVVIFLTLAYSDVSNGSPPVKVAHEVLADKWGSQLESNELDALITRVTDQVILLKN